MRRQFWTFVIFLFVWVASTMGQEKYSVTIKIRNNNKSSHVGENFYLTSNFHAWDPKGIVVGQVPDFGQSITIKVSDIPAGLFEYKFTRGTWETSASTAEGRLEGPLSTTISSDTTLYTDIDGWRDDFQSSTASPQVHVLDSAFYFPSLELSRRVWIYLPKSYATSSRKYPVIYMHDGDDLFDEATSKGRIGPLEWHVDETIDSSAHDAIVVAIAQAEDISQRQNEYFVRPNTRFKNPVGAKYMADIVHILKPYVDQRYRTLSDKDHTAMAGSSVGGLFTFYAGLMYPDVFGTLGIFSSSFWLDDENITTIIQEIEDTKSIAEQQYFFYGGGNENRLKPDGSYVRMDDDLRTVADMLIRQVDATVEISINPEGRHGAWYWQKAFPDFYSWWASTTLSQTN